MLDGERSKTLPSRAITTSPRPPMRWGGGTSRAHHHRPSEQAWYEVDAVQNPVTGRWLAIGSKRYQRWKRLYPHMTVQRVRRKIIRHSQLVPSSRPAESHWRVRKTWTREPSRIGGAESRTKCAGNPFDMITTKYYRLDGDGVSMPFITDKTNRYVAVYFRSGHAGTFKGYLNGSGFASRSDAEHNARSSPLYKHLSKEQGSVDVRVYRLSDSRDKPSRRRRSGGAAEGRSGGSGEGRSGRAGEGRSGRAGEGQKDVYEIHDNGGRPFRVHVDRVRKQLTIFKDHQPLTDDDKPDWRVIPEFHQVPYHQIWVGVDPDPEQTGLTVADSTGANILYQDARSKKLVNIGMMIEEFPLDSGDRVVEYHVPFGGNDVPMPYLVTRRWTYLIAEGVRIPTSKRGALMQSKMDIPDPYWNEYFHQSEKERERHYTSYPFRILVERDS